MFMCTVHGVPALASLRDFGLDGVLCTFRNIPAAGAEAADIARSSKLSSLLAGQAVQYVMADGTARPSHFKSFPSPPHPSPLARQGRAPCSINSLRPLRTEYDRVHYSRMPMSIHFS